VIVLSRKNGLLPGATEESPNRTHRFDAGAAWGYLALQASLSGWPAHGRAGFDHDRARLELSIPDDVAIEAAVAIGRLGDKTLLPEGLQARETPSPRLPLAQVIYEGAYQAG
jgi:hypothetical protein